MLLPASKIAPPPLLQIPGYAPDQIDGMDLYYRSDFHVKE